MTFSIAYQTMTQEHTLITIIETGNFATYCAAQLHYNLHACSEHNLVHLYNSSFCKKKKKPYQNCTT